MSMRHPLFKGCTRPSMKFGVPVKPFGLTLGIFLLLGLYASFLFGIGVALMIWGSFLPVFGVMRMMTAADDQMLHLFFLKARHRAPLWFRGSLGFWNGCAAYAPTTLIHRKKG